MGSCKNRALGLYACSVYRIFCLYFILSVIQYHLVVGIVSGIFLEIYEQNSVAKYLSCSMVQWTKKELERAKFSH